MSVEVADMRFKFKPDGPFRLKWFYHPLNDLESVWWLAAWSILNRDIYFVRCSPAMDVSTASTGAGMVTRAACRRTLADMLQQPRLSPSGQTLDVDNDQLVPSGATQETRVDRVRRIKAQYYFASTLFIPNCNIHTRFIIMHDSEILTGLFEDAKPLHPIISVLGGTLLDTRTLLVQSYRDIEMDVTQLRTRAIDVAGGLCDQFRAIFDGAEGCIGRLDAEVHVRRLSDEHWKIMDAEKMAIDEQKAALAVVEAQFGVWKPRKKLNARPETDLDTGLHQSRTIAPANPASEPLLEGTREHAGPYDGPRRKRIRTLPPVSEVPEPGPEGDASGAFVDRLGSQALPPIPEEDGVPNEEEAVAGPSKKRRRVADDEEPPTMMAGPSRVTRKSTRTKPNASAAGPSTKPQRRKPTHQATATQVLPPAPKRRRAEPAAHAPALAPTRTRNSRARATEDVPVAAGAPEGEVGVRTTRPRKRPRIAAVDEHPNSNPGGRILRPRKK